MDYKYDSKNNSNEKKQIDLALSEFWILYIKRHYQKLKYRAHLHSTYTKKKKSEISTYRIGENVFKSYT